MIAIDPSMTGFCIAGRDADGAHWFETLTSKPATGIARFKRYDDELVTPAMTFALNHDLVILEGYSFGSSGRGVYLGELGALLRSRLLRAGSRVVEVAPGMLKKFATGKGGASKVAVASKLTARYGATFNSDNEADAYCLLMIGEALGELEAVQDAWVPTFQRDVIKKLREAS